MSKYTKCEIGHNRYGWFVMFISENPAIPHFRSAMPDETTARQTIAAFGAVAVCREVHERAAPMASTRHEFANGRATLAGVSLDAKTVVDAAAVVGIADGLPGPAPLVIDRCPETK